MSSLPTTHWPRVITLWLCGVLAAMQFSKVSFAFQALQATYGATPAAMGWILSTVGMVGLVLGVTMGLCAPAIGYRRLLLVGMGLGAVLALVQSLVPPFPLLWLTRLFEGVSQLAVVVAAPTLIMQHSAPQHRSIAMGLWSTFVGVAFALTAAGGGWVLAHFQLSGLLVVHAVGMALMGAAVLWLLPRDSAATQAWPALASLPQLHARIYSQWATALPGGCFFFYTATAIALLTFIPQQAGADRAWLAVALPLLSIGGNFLAGWLAQSVLRPSTLVPLAFAGVAAAGLALGLCLWQGIAIAPVALLLMALVGLAGGAAFALVPYLSDAPPVQARATGAVAQMGNLGSTIGPPVFAYAIASMGPLGLVLPLLVWALVGLSLATWGIRQHQRQTP
ncbi:MFS transporter [Rhodoferax sp.]|uniref:MFS transporter n=1 Tax=Rhodoferax sp. TaxID=50421 RepID=UPI0025E03391|nr:MFS transporter [Rhodoferax sp.]